MVAKYLPLPVSLTVSQWQNVGHRLLKGSQVSSKSVEEFWNPRGIWVDDKLHYVYATNDFITVRRWLQCL